MEAAPATDLPPPSFKKNPAPYKSPFNSANHAANTGTAEATPRQENGDQKRIMLVAKRKHPFPRAQATNPGMPDSQISVTIDSRPPSTPTSEPRAHSSSSSLDTAISKVHKGSQVPRSLKGFQKGNRDFKNQPGPARRGGKARNGRPRPPDIDDTPDPNADKKVLVSGFPAYTPAAELSRVLGELGSATIERCRNRLAVVAFSSAAEAAAALAADGDLYIYGELLSVRPYTTPAQVDQMYHSRKKVYSREKDVDLIEPHEIELSGDFEQQLSSVLRAVRLTAAEAAAVDTLCRDLDAALAPLWPGCRAVPFGSIPTGLGIKSSDADVYVAGVADGAADFVSRARRALAARAGVFARLVPIPSANTPILKLLHAPSGRRCDLSAKTPLGARNSRLLRALLAADARLPPLALALKYWARVHRLTGTGRLSNYALALLLLHYLQRPALALAPPVAALQGPLSELLVDHWDAGFREPPPPPAAASAAPVRDLLGGFYEFYASFDFERLVVCPLLGEPLPREAFAEPARLPQRLARYCDNVAARRAAPLRTATPLCVQDPFELSHNVASAVSPKLAERLRAHLAHAAALYARERPACAGLLRGVLLTAPPPPPPPARAEPWLARLRLAPRAAPALPEDVWRARVRHALLDTILVRLLRMALQPVPPVASAEAAEDAGAGAVVGGERYRCSARHALWRRPRARAAHGDWVGAQEQVSARLAREGHAACWLRLALQLTWRERPRACELRAELEEGRPDVFHGFIKFMHTAMPDWFHTLMQAPDETATRPDVSTTSPPDVSAASPPDVSAAFPPDVSAASPPDVSAVAPCSASAPRPPAPSSPAADLSRQLATITVADQPS